MNTNIFSFWFDPTTEIEIEFTVSAADALAVDSLSVVQKQTRGEKEKRIEEKKAALAAKFFLQSRVFA